MQRPPLATIGGIPVRVDSSFLFGALIIFLWSGGGTAGFYTIVAMAVFILIHEFGHALVARRFGADASVTMGFLGGYTSFSTKRPLSTGQNIAISLAGAGAQLLVAIPTLWLVLQWLSREFRDGVRTGTASSAMTHAADVYVAVSWAGILLAFLNLIPALPLDGGQVLSSLLRTKLGERTEQLMRTWSFGVAGVLAAAYVIGLDSDRSSALGSWTPHTLMSPSFGSMVSAELSSVWSFIVGGSLLLPMFIVLGVAATPRPGIARSRTRVDMPGDAPGTQRPLTGAALVRAADDAERRGWQLGTLEGFPIGAEPSPWLVAFVAERRGDAVTASAALFALSDERARSWVNPPDLAHPVIEAALSRLPDEVSAASAVLEARVYAGPAGDLAACATQRYSSTGDATALYLAAAGFAQRGLNGDALMWLRQAVERQPNVTLLETIAPFHHLRGTPEFEELVTSARAAHG